MTEGKDAQRNTNHDAPPASLRLVELGGFEPPTYCLPGSVSHEPQRRPRRQAIAPSDVPSLTPSPSHINHRPSRAASAVTPTLQSSVPSVAALSHGAPDAGRGSQRIGGKTFSAPDVGSAAARGFYRSGLFSQKGVFAENA